jgi:hypothetical protein
MSRGQNDAGVSATVTRHGTTVKWSSPQASDGWVRIGLGLRWGQYDGKFKKKDGGQDSAAENRRGMHSHTLKSGEILRLKH